jgi:hypothetical protein
VLALFLPIAAVLYISAEALSPKGTDQVATDTATALKLLAIAVLAGPCRLSCLGMAGERHSGRPADCRGGQRRSISRRPASGLHCNRDS